MTVLRPDEKLPVYFMAAPIGDHITDISIAVTRLIGQLEMLIVENIGTVGEDDLIGRLRAMGIVSAGQQLVGLSGLDHHEVCPPCVDQFVKDRKSFGMIADKGLCCFVDPGRSVVRHLLDNYSDTVELVPVGASSAMDAAIMISGVNCTNFVFMGHYPESHHWFPEMVSRGVPTIAYVRGDSLKAFWLAVRQQFGSDGALCLSVFKNLRARLRTAQECFMLTDTPECIDAIAEPLKTPQKDSCDNFVVILHRHWNSET